MIILYVLLQVSLICAIVFWAMSRTHRIAEQETINALRQWMMNYQVFCEDILQKRKGNNFTDQMYRAALKGRIGTLKDIIQHLQP